jgi:putative nucleotidyltransferase with HDIG domain
MAWPVKTPARAARQRYIAVDLTSLRADRLLDFDLYVCVEGRMVLYRGQALDFTEACRARLLESKVRQVYIDAAQRAAYLGYMEQELPQLLKDEKIPQPARANIVYTTAKVIVEAAFDDPTYGDNIKRSAGMVEQTVAFLACGPSSFRSLVKLADTDYKLYSHSVNVCTLSLGLAQHVGIGDARELAALGIGAMLHDVGKTRIDERILRKRTPLTHAEFELMKKHVEYGLEILEQIPDLPPVARIPILQHNEREDGSGYPRALCGDGIHLFGKITAIADVFDAMTSHRVYRKACTAFDAFKEMLRMPLDSRLLRRFIGLLGPDEPA